MRPAIDFEAAQTNELDPVKVRAMALDKASMTTMLKDSLIIQIVREQQVSFYDKLKQSLNIEDNNSLTRLHHDGYPLIAWGVSMSYVGDSADVMEFNLAQSRRMALRFNQRGQVLLLRMYQPGKYGLVFNGAQLSSSFDSLLVNLGYNPTNYVLQPFDSDVNRSDNANDDPLSREFVYNQIEDVTGQPDAIIISAIPDPFRSGRPPPVLNPNAPESGIERPITSEGDSIAPRQSRLSFALESVIVEYDGVPLSQTSRNEFLENSVYIYSIAILIVGFIIIATVRRIYRNQVDWRRGSWVFFTFGTGLIIWAVLHLKGYSLGNVPPNLFWLITISSIINVLLAGFFIAISYITWESMARIQHQPQIAIVDAMWRGRFFLRETGMAVVNGYALGGALLGVFALILYSFDGLLLQLMNASGLHEATSLVPSLSIPIGALVSAGFLVFGPLGVIYGFCYSRAGGGWICAIITAIAVALSMTSLSRVIHTDQPLLMEIMIFFLFGLALVYILNKYGMITTVTAVTIFCLAVNVLPITNSESSFYSASNWVIVVMTVLPFIFGLLTIRYGQPIAREERYIPEYMETTIKQERFEREIEIARESQFALMPVSAPILSAHDVKGFFIPSLEVGGDYYDYHVRNDENGNPTSLFLALVDVSGKAMKAAMHAVFTSGLILSRMYSDAPEIILRTINPIVKEKTDSRTFITCIVGEIDLMTNNLRLSNAGHCQPILKRKGEAQFVVTPDPRFPLGMRATVDYQGLDLQLESGDVLILYSDGLPEAKNGKNEEYGFDRTLRLIADMPTEKLSSTEICLNIKNHIQNYSNYSMRDDTTVICLKLR